MRDLCPHRFAPLSQGRLAPDGQGIVCSYHGWKFSPSGSCTDIPQISDPKAKAAALGSPRSCVESFPAKARAIRWREGSER